MAASPYQLVNTDISGSRGLLNVGNKTSGAKSLLLSSLDDGTSVVFESNGQTSAKIEVADEDTSLVFRIGTSLSEVFRVTENGRVGIGTFDPDGLLEVSKAGNSTNVFPLYVSNTGTGANTRASIRFDIANVYYGSIGGGIEGDSTSSIGIDAPSSTSSLIFTRNNRASELGRFDSAGNFGIGVSSPALKLSVNGGVWVGDGSGNEVGRFIAASGNLHLRSVSSLLLGANGVEKARIDADGKLLVGKSSSTSSALFQLAGDASFESTGYVKLPSGTTGERPGTPLNGMIRYNSELTKFEGYKNSTWGTIGGAGATGGGTDEVFLENGNTVINSYTISAGKNAVSAGPITINPGAVVTVPSGASWVIV